MLQEGSFRRTICAADHAEQLQSLFAGYGFELMEEECAFVRSVAEGIEALPAEERGDDMLPDELLEKVSGGVSFPTVQDFKNAWKILTKKKKKNS